MKKRVDTEQAFKEAGMALKVVADRLRKLQMDNKLKIIVAGGRDFNDKYHLYVTLDTLIRSYADDISVEIVTGGARGADSIGKQYACDRHLQHVEFHALWDRYGRSAGYRRNAQMANYVEGSGVLVAFWDSQSKGTAHMIDTAKRKNIPVYIINY